MKLTRPINESEQRNFDTLIAAMQADRVCLVSTFDEQDQPSAILICAVNCSPDAYEPIDVQGRACGLQSDTLASLMDVDHTLVHESLLPYLFVLLLYRVQIWPVEFCR